MVFEKAGIIYARIGGIYKIMKAVIFDLDGVLMDTEPLWEQVDLEMLGEKGFKPTEELFRRRLGTGNLRTVEIYKEEFDLKDSVQELAKEREKRFFVHLDKNIPPMEGALDLIKELSTKGIRMAIATSGPHKDRMQKILEQLGIKSFIEAIVTGDELERLKPSPDIFLLAAKKLNVDPKDCLVFEDAPNGVRAAKAAGMMAYGVSRDEETRKQLREKGADEVFSSLLEVKI